MAATGKRIQESGYRSEMYRQVTNKPQLFPIFYGYLHFKIN
jgi:hypothetical protein